MVLHGDARELDLGGPYDGVVTSPPYPGLIDYHEQHRYAYELLGLDDRRELELGAAARGTSGPRSRSTSTGIAAVLARVRDVAAARRPVCIVVNDRRDLYPEILERAGLRLDERLRAARQPAHGASRRRVLRDRPRLLARESVHAFDTDAVRLSP